jgi:hypothetical protein
MSEHLTEEDLVLCRYGEAGPDAEKHVVACAECAARLEALRHALERVPADVPERAPDYEARLWARLEPHLEAPGGVLRLGPRRFALPAALAASLLLALLVGRPSGPPVASPAPVAAIAAPERVLLGAVSDHLERSRRVLAEMAGTPASAGPVDLRAERALAANLVANSRLYRQTAARAGEARVADLLDDLERVLIEIANGPDQLRPDELRALKKRIDDRDLLFKVRALQSRVHERASKRPKPRTIS